MPNAVPDKMSELLHHVVTMGAERPDHSPDQPPSGRGFVVERAGSVGDTATVDEIDRAIRYALDNDGLDPRIRDAFIDALLDKRLRAAG